MKNNKKQKTETMKNDGKERKQQLKIMKRLAKNNNKNEKERKKKEA